MPSRRPAVAQRTAPGRQRTAPGARRSSGRRMPLRAMLGALLALVLMMALLAVEPYGDYRVARDRVDDLSRQQAELVAAVDALEQERARLDDPAALEEEARSELGLSRPGEIPYIVVNPPTGEPGAPVSAPPAPDDEPPVVQRVIDWFVSLTVPVG